MLSDALSMHPHISETMKDEIMDRLDVTAL